MNLLARVHQLNNDLVVFPGPDPPPEAPARHPAVEPEVVLRPPARGGPDTCQGRRDRLAGQVPELGRQAPQHVGVQHGLAALVHVPHHAQTAPGLGDLLQHLNPAVKLSAGVVERFPRFVGVFL